MNTHMMRFFTLACALFTCGTALAHSGSHEPGSLFSGLMHPLLGVDHVLALLAIGLWAATAQGGRSWLPAAAFLASMVTGAALAVQGVALPGVEAGIAVSVLVAGLLLVTFARVSPLNATALIALFALSHGQAHGLEMPVAAAPLLYALGLVCTSSLMLLAGMGLGEWMRHGRAAWLLRGAGVLSGGAGAWMLLGV